MVFPSMYILWWIVIALLAVMFLLTLYTASHYTTSFSLMAKDFWVRIPVIGKMATWRRMIDGTGKNWPTGKLLPPEKALYKYYEHGVPPISRGEFEKYKEYLKLAHQSGRKPLPGWMLLILVLLTVAEAYGTGALIAPLIASDITPDGALYIGAGIALVLAVVTLFFTHAAGQDLFQNRLIATVRNSYRHATGFLVVDNGRQNTCNDLKLIDPRDDQNKDAAYPPTTRLAARIGVTTKDKTKPHMMNIILATLLIVAAFVLTTWYRHYELVLVLDCQSSGYNNMAQGGGLQHFQNMLGNLGNGIHLPYGVTRPARRSQQHARNFICGDQRDAINVGVILLGVIYLFTQLLGVVTGYKYGFANDEARQAYHETSRYISYESFLNHVVSPVAQRADMRMAQLRTFLVKSNPDYIHRHKEFDFLDHYLQEIGKRETGKTPDSKPATIDNGTASHGQAGKLSE